VGEAVGAGDPAPALLSGRGLPLSTGVEAAVASTLADTDGDGGGEAAVVCAVCRLHAATTTSTHKVSGAKKRRAAVTFRPHFGARLCRFARPRALALCCDAPQETLR
jgi:hypothetical protein